MMNINIKPFACSQFGCNMTFTNEDHLYVHKKKHEMELHLNIEDDCESADQTPTPTRFIRNCEEVGLFQDLQHVNPFDETFRKATELVKIGKLPLPKECTSDSLNTPHFSPSLDETSNKYNLPTCNDIEFSFNDIKNDTLNEDLSHVMHNSIENDVLQLSSGTNLLTLKNEEYISQSHHVLAIDLLTRPDSESEQKKKEASKNANIKTSIENFAIVDTSLLSVGTSINTKEIKVDSLTNNFLKHSNLNSSIKNSQSCQEILKKSMHSTVNKKNSKYRLERIRECNRRAQTRSRQKKKYFIFEMEKELNNLKQERTKLVNENQALQNTVNLLNQILIFHQNCSAATDCKTIESISKLIQKSNSACKRLSCTTPKHVKIVPNNSKVITITPVQTGVLVPISLNSKSTSAPTISSISNISNLL